MALVYISELQSDMIRFGILLIGVPFLIIYLFITSDNGESRKSYDEKVNPLFSTDDKKDKRNE